MLSPVNQRLWRLVAPMVEQAGFALVRVRMAGIGRGRTLQVMMERPAGDDITVDDCATVSRMLEEVLLAAEAREEALRDPYRLEISSPGLDRPLVQPDDFARFTGRVIRLETTDMIDRRKRFEGTLEGFAQGVVRLAMDDATYDIPLTMVREARCVVTDDMMRALLRASTGDGAAAAEGHVMTVDDTSTARKTKTTKTAKTKKG